MELRQLQLLGALVSAVGLLAVLFFLSGFSFDTGEGPFVVLAILDGDTVDLDNGERVRLSGINAPEKGECGYEDAKLFLENLTLGKEVFLEQEVQNRDSYGRLLRYLSVGDVAVNALLVEKGYVRVFDAYNESIKKYEEFKMIEQEAVAAGVGVWGCVDPQEGCLYVASKNSDVYHVPGCKWAKRIAPENLICFHSEDELAGYRPAKSC